MNASLLLQLALILAVAKIAGELAERFLKLPAVLGEIVSGNVVGGSLLKLVDGGDLTLNHLAEIGAILLLFEVGLESDLEALLKVGREAKWVALQL